MGGRINQVSNESYFSQNVISSEPNQAKCPNLDGRTVTIVHNDNNLPSQQHSNIKQITEQKLNNTVDISDNISISINGTIDIENKIHAPAITEFILNYYEEDNLGNLNFYELGSNLEEGKKAILEERIVGVKDNGENGIEFIGKSKAREAINNAQQNNHNINIKKSDGESVEVKQFTFRKLNNSEKAFFNSAIKAHLLFLENQSKLNKIKKEKTSDSFITTVNYEDAKNTNQVKEKHFPKEEKSFYVQAEPTEQFTRSQLRKLQEKFLEVAIIKEAKAEEQDKKKLEKKLEDKNFFESNDLFKSIQNQDILSKTNLKTVKIIKKFNFTPQVATCTLRTI